ncbi:MAG: hypothetical protein H6814_11135 [Phycisphaeraceae bacterium]|nr:hypothetical protein [Phycisphaeraceae bacterium]
MIRHPIRLTAPAVVACSLLSSAHAEVLRWQVAGIYQDVTGTPPGALAPLATGDTFNLNIYFDSDTVQTVGADRDSASYGAVLATSSDVSLRTNFFGGGQLLQTGSGSPAVFFDIFDNEPGDRIEAMIGQIGVPVGRNGKSPVVSMSFSAMGADSLWDGAGPQTDIQFPDFLSGAATLSYPGGSATALLVSWQTTVIPSPGSLPALGIGLWVLRRRRR